MRHFRLGLLICAVLVWTTTVVGQATSGSQTAQGTALLQQSLAALTRGAPVTDVTMTGTARRIAGSDDETGTARLKATVAGDSRVDLSFSSGLRSEIRNHAGTPLQGTLPPGISATAAQGPQPVGAWSGSDGASHPIANHNLVTDAGWFPAITLRSLISSPNVVLSYVGPETKNGAAVIHIIASQQFPDLSGDVATLMQHLSKTDIFLDTATFLPVAIDFSTHPDDNAAMDIPTEIRFSDYRLVGAANAPFHIQKFLNNSLILDVSLQNVTVNSGLSATDFAVQ